LKAENFSLILLISLVRRKLHFLISQIKEKIANLFNLKNLLFLSHTNSMINPQLYPPNYYPSHPMGKNSYSSPRFKPNRKKSLQYPAYITTQ
jgi:hypothetical protein